jgi:biopolymer transport protein ExbD
MGMSAGGNSDSRAIADINVTPMVDIMLVLLIIFMVVTPMLQKGVSVDLAKTYNPREMRDADKDDATVVAVNREGKIFLGATKLEKTDLGAKVKDSLADKVDKTVYIKSDRRAKYSDVVDVVDIVRTTGVDTLGLITEKIQEKSAAQ